jgi:hydroxymethylpyrimidine/phosphomethylpyrimidine kinase
MALTIAGSDPTGGAGLQLDLRVFQRLGVHGMAVPTALVAQTTEKVHRVLPAFPNVVGEQLTFLLADIVPNAVKIGMLATDDVLLSVAHVLDRYDFPVVVDPVLRASDGTYLLERRAYGSLLGRIVNGATLVTPNLPEAEVLTGCADPEQAAAALLEIGARAVLVTGGHRDGAPNDLLATPEGQTWIEGVRRGNAAVHGTGCALSSAIAARLARGESLIDSVRAAKAFVEEAIAGAFAAGRGQLLLRI